MDRIGMSCVGGMPCGNHGYECSCPIDFRGPNCEREYTRVYSITVIVLTHRSFTGLFI